MVHRLARRLGLNRFRGHNMPCVDGVLTFPRNLDNSEPQAGGFWRLPHLQRLSNCTWAGSGLLIRPLAEELAGGRLEAVPCVAGMQQTCDFRTDLTSYSA